MGILYIWIFSPKDEFYLTWELIKHLLKGNKKPKDKETFKAYLKKQKKMERMKRKEKEKEKDDEDLRI